MDVLRQRRLDSRVPKPEVENKHLPTVKGNTSKTYQKKGYLPPILRDRNSSVSVPEINEQSKEYTLKEEYEPFEPFEGKSRYNSMYRWVYLPKRENFKPEEVVYKSEMPFDGTTSYKTQFPKHDVELRKDYTPKEVIEPPDQPFEGKTQYNSMYRWVYLPERENFKPEEVVYKSEMPFDGTTSYKTQFPKHDVEPRKDYTPKEVYEPPHQPFEGQTHYNSTFRWVYLPKRENFKPEEVVYKSEMPFDGTTSYKTQIPKHDVEPRKDYTPIEVYEPPDQPFEGQTHYNSNFRWVYLPKRENFKPEEVVYRSEMPFDGTTSYKTQFPKHDVEPRKDYTPIEVYEPPDQPFEGQTHYNSNFRWVYLPKRENFKPEEVVYRSEMPFDDTTSYKTQFPKYDVEPRKDYTPKEVYTPPENPLEGLTDGRRKNFTLKYQSKSEKFEPAEVVFLCEEPFHDASSDKIQFPKCDPKPRKDYTPKNVYIPPENPLEGLTDGRRKNFTLKYQSKSEKFEPAEVVFLCEEPFHDASSDKIQFPKRDPNPHKDYTPKNVYIPPENPLEGLTDGRRKNFTLKYQSKKENFKEEEVVFQTEVPLDDTTSYKTHLPKRDAKPRNDYTPIEVYIPPENPLEGLTDGRRKNFTLKHRSKKENLKQEKVVFRTEVHLHDTTSYKTHFPKRDATPRKYYSPMPPDEPLDGVTDRKGKFNRRYLPMIESMKQNEIAYKSQMMDWSSVSKLHYVKPSLEQKLPVMNPSDVILKRGWQKRL